MMVMRREETTTAHPVSILSAQYDLGSFGYFHRANVKEFIVFFSRMLMERTSRGQRHSVKHADTYVVHLMLRSDGLGSLCVCDAEYPQRAAYLILHDLLKEFTPPPPPLQKDEKDMQIPFPYMERAIVEYQDPTKADKLLRIHEDLDKTIAIVHKTIDSVLDRGVKLEHLVQQSEDLGIQSKLFYNNAASANRCCVIA